MVLTKYTKVHSLLTVIELSPFSMHKALILPRKGTGASDIYGLKPETQGLEKDYVSSVSEVDPLTLGAYK